MGVRGHRRRGVHSCRQPCFVERQLARQVQAVRHPGRTVRAIATLPQLAFQCVLPRGVALCAPGVRWRIAFVTGGRIERGRTGGCGNERRHPAKDCCERRSSSSLNRTTRPPLSTRWASGPAGPAALSLSTAPRRRVCPAPLAHPAGIPTNPPRVVGGARPGHDGGPRQVGGHHRVSRSVPGRGCFLVRHQVQAMPSCPYRGLLFGVSPLRLCSVLESHTPSFTTTGSVSPSTVIRSLWPWGTGRSAPSRSIHCEGRRAALTFAHGRVCSLPVCRAHRVALQTSGARPV